MTSDYRDPPHNLEVEQALLGAILLDNTVLDRITEIVRPDDFFEPAHGRIYEAIQTIVARGESADPVRLRPVFDEDEGLADVGGGAYLGRLVASASIIGAEDYARTVRDYAIRRALVQAGQALVARAEDDLEDALSVADDAQTAIARACADIGASRRSSWAHEALEEAIQDHIRATHEGSIPGVKTGFRALDDIIGVIRPSELTYIAGRTGMGKSAIAVALALNVARSGHGIGIISLEMDRKAVAARMASAILGDLPYEDIINYRLNLAQIDRVKEAYRELATLPIAVCDAGGMTTEAIRSQARLWQREFTTKGRKLDLLIIDHLLKIRPSRSAGMVEAVTETSNALLEIARNTGLATVVFSQINRGVEHQDDKRPSLADLKWSGAIEEDGARVIFLYRPEYYLRKPPPEAPLEEHQEYSRRMQTEGGQIELIVAKNRHGRVGSVTLRCDIACNKFGDL